MIDSYLNDTGWRVNKAPWVLYDGLSVAALTLTDSLPNVPFKCSVRLYAVTGHTDVTGTVVVGSETLTFVGATRKVTSVALSALPVVTTANLDCMIEIVALDMAGQPLILETQTAIDCAFQNTESRFQDSQGAWLMSSAIAFTDDTGSKIGTIFSFNGYDYNIAKVKDLTYEDCPGFELWLTGKTLAPSGREIAEECDMLKSVYDKDKDGVVDKAEGILVLDAVPTDLSSFADGDLFAVGDKIYRVRVV